MDTTITENPPPQPAILLTKSTENTLQDSPVANAIDFEKTPEFEAWRASKLQEWSNHLKNNWKIVVAADKLVLLEQGSGFPDPENRKAYAMIGSNNNYIDPVTQKVAINPATNRPMTYTIWRPLFDAPVPAEPTT